MLKQKCEYYESDDFHEYCNCHGIIPSPWRDVREELIRWIADNTKTLPTGMYFVNADALVSKIDELLPAPPAGEEAEG